MSNNQTVLKLLSQINSLHTAKKQTKALAFTALGFVILGGAIYIYAKSQEKENERLKNSNAEKDAIIDLANNQIEKRNEEINRLNIEKNSLLSEIQNLRNQNQILSQKNGSY